MRAGASEEMAGVETLGALLDRRARDPDRLQYRLIERTGTVEVTVGSVHRWAATVGAGLGARCTPGTPVVLLVPAGRPFVAAFFGAVRAGLVAVPVATPGRSRLQRGLEPLRGIVADCCPAAVVTTDAIRQLVLGALDETDPLRRPAWLTIESLLGDVDREHQEPPPTTARDVAYLQYTSGSTAAPKGVEITHGAVLANLATIHRAFANRPDDHGMVWLPPHHDMGLVGGLLAPLASEIDVTLADPAQFLQSPVRWLRWISDHGATISGGPDFAYRLCVDRVRDDQLEGIDLSRWRLAFMGAEPLDASTIEDFCARFAPFGFSADAPYPCFGLAEATLMVTGSDPDVRPVVRAVSRRGLDTDGRAVAPTSEHDARRVVGCGRPVGPDDEVLIVEPTSGVPQGAGRVGEIWYRGPSAGRGYHGDPVRSAATFDARTADGRGPFVRTGDLGFVDDDGELFVVGRRKDVIVIRGRNLDAHDLERAVLDVLDALDGPRLGSVAALPRADGSGLAVVVEVGRSAAPDTEAIRRAAQAALAQGFGVRADDVVLVAPGTLPRTTSGKLRRAAASELLRSGRLGRIEAPTDPGPAPTHGGAR